VAATNTGIRPPRRVPRAGHPSRVIVQAQRLGVDEPASRWWTAEFWQVRTRRSLRNVTVTTKPGAVCLRSRSGASSRPRRRRPPLHTHPSPRSTCTVEDLDGIGETAQQSQHDRLVVVLAGRCGIGHLDGQPRSSIVDGKDHRIEAFCLLAAPYCPGTGLPDRKPEFIEPVLLEMRPATDGNRDQTGGADMPRTGWESQLHPDHGDARFSPGYAGPPAGPPSEGLPSAGCCSSPEERASASEA